MEESIEFAKWCLEDKTYVYDSSMGWFHRKTMKVYTWEEIYIIYLKTKNK